MNESIEYQIHQTLIDRQQTLSLAESCTGGALAVRFTQLAGCSQYFLGSIIAYSNRLKVNVLNVDEAIIHSKGAVSEEVAEQMVEGVLNLTQSDVGIAVTGIAGPGGGATLKPVGTICAAIAFKGQRPETWTFHLEGNRQKVINQTVDVLLNQFWLLLKK